MLTKKTFVKITLIILFLVHFAFPPVAFAAEFSTSYQVTYQVQESGKTTVTSQISLTNLKSDLYAKEYRLTIGTEAIENVQAFDSLGQLELLAEKGEGQTEIKATFNEKVVGVGKTLTFTLSYDSAEIATKQGNVWEVVIPKPSADKTITSYRVTLSVPAVFGEPAYLKPQPAEGMTWTLDAAKPFSISAAFGPFQSLDFDLLYHLRNASVTPRRYQIALPPDTAYQKIFLSSLTPEPKKVFVDEDGNWLAEYLIFPQQSFPVNAQGTVKIFLEKRPDFIPNNLTDKQKYLESQEFWEADDPEILTLAQKFETPRQIYQYVVDTLSYDTSRVGRESERLGAKAVIKASTKATCKEFTDLFITLCRAAGIPAREVNGYGLSSDRALKPLSLVEDVLHAWPEYFDQEKKIWVPVDPTWEKTTGGIDYFQTFDFNHFAFVLHGLSSQTPAPPGGYKDSVDKEKNVKVAFSEKEPVSLKKEPEMVLNFPETVMGGLPIKGEVVVKNPGSEALSDLVLEITSSNLSPKVKKLQISTLPPFGQETFTTQFASQSLLFWGENQFTFKLGDLTMKRSVEIKPWVMAIAPYLLALSIVLTTFSLSLFLVRKLWKFR